MHIFNTSCPHCGEAASFTGDKFDTEMRCLNCGETFAFMSDSISNNPLDNMVLDTHCPHCGNDLKINQFDFGCKLRCPNCNGEFGFSRLRGEVKLYRPYAAVLWGIFLGPFLGCWFFKKNFEEMGMMEEAEEYRPLMISLITKFLIVPLAICAVLIVAVLLQMLMPFTNFLGPIAKLIKVLGNIIPLAIGIHTTATYAAKYCNGADCLSYHVYKSTWPAALLFFFVVAPVLVIPLTLIYLAECFALIALLHLIFGGL